jgi:hypothetical protein
MTNSVPRGIRNNNAGNIRISPTRWKGKKTPSADKSFEQFDTPENGIRAMAKILLAYNKLYGLDTVEKIINRWAPPIENDTDSYVRAVSSALGVNPDDVIRVKSPNILSLLIRAIIKHENGQQPYMQATIDLGIKRALGRLD